MSENKRIQVLSNGSLYISEVEGKRGEQYDEGFYQCLAMNRHGAILSQKAHLNLISVLLGFPGGSVVKNQPASARDTGDRGLILGLGRSPRRGNDNPLQYS